MPATDRYRYLNSEFLHCALELFFPLILHLWASYEHSHGCIVVHCISVFWWKFHLFVWQFIIYLVITCRKQSNIDRALASYFLLATVSVIFVSCEELGLLSVISDSISYEMKVSVNFSYFVPSSWHLWLR